MMNEDEKKTTKPKRKRKAVPAKVSYINVKRADKNYRDKYKREVESAVKNFATTIGKTSGEEFSNGDWMNFFKTILIPLDKDSELHMIDLFKDNRPLLNQLLVLHNTKASENIAEVYFKRYLKNSPTQWYDLDDFKQMANEGLAIAAERFDIEKGNRFLTYATWWMLNKVRHPNQERGAMVNHISMSKILGDGTDEGDGTFEDILSEKNMAPDWQSPSGESESHLCPNDALERKSINENLDLCSTLRDFGEIDFNKLDKSKVERMVDYLSSIVEQCENSYNNKQIFLYLFKRVFAKCKDMFKNDAKIANYVECAAKNKSDLLRRLNMDEKQYNITCKKLTHGGYDGL